VPAVVALISEGFGSETEPAGARYALKLRRGFVGCLRISEPRGNVGKALAKFAAESSRTFFGWYKNCSAALISHLQCSKIVQGIPEGWEGCSQHTLTGNLIEFDADGLPTRGLIGGVTLGMAQSGRIRVPRPHRSL
jgi:hypothetical protein